MIDITKKYCYRNGDPARVLCVDAHLIPYGGPVISMDVDGGLWRHYDHGGLYEDEASEYDLIEVKEKKRLEFWVNIRTNNRVDCWDCWATKGVADSWRGNDRIACKKVVIEYCEGEYEEKIQRSNPVALLGVRPG